MFNVKKKKVRSRIASLLVAAMLLTLLGLFSLPALALTPFTNASLQAVVDDDPRVSGDPNTISVLDLSGRNDLFGDIDVAELMDAFPLMEMLNVSGTNVTAIHNAGGVLILDLDTFAIGHRSFVFATNLITYGESEGDFPISRLFDEVRIVSSGNPSLNAPIPAGMFVADGTATIAGDAHTIAPDGVIPQSVMVGKTPGVDQVMLDFPVAFSANARLDIGGMNLDIRLGEYVLAPVLGQPGDPGSVFDGGYVEFILTRSCEDGFPTALESLPTYEVRLSLNYGLSWLTLINPQVMAPSGMEMRIRVESQEMTTTSAWLRVSRTGTDSKLAQADVVKVINANISDLWLREYYYDSSISTWFPATDPATDADVFDGQTIYIRGGTSISSADSDRVMTIGNPTMYLLRGTVLPGGGAPGIDQYISANYFFQVQQQLLIDPLFADYVDFELERVWHPPSQGYVLGIVFIATTMTGMQLSDAIHVEIENLLPEVPPVPNAFIGLNVEIISVPALGYRIYQIPQWYVLNAGLNTRMALENAIYNEHPGIRPAAHYARYVNNDEHLVQVTTFPDGVTIVENSTVYLVATAYFAEGGRRFLLPHDMFADNAGWYHQTQVPLNMFNVTSWSRITGADGNTSMRGRLTNIPGFAGGTSVLEINAHDYGYDSFPPNGLFNLGVEREGILIFGRDGVGNNFSIRLQKVEKGPMDVLFAPAGHVTPFPGGLILPMMPLATPGNPLYDLNIAGEFPISIGGTYEFEMFTIYTNHTESRSRVTATTPIVNTPVVLDNASHIRMLDLVEERANSGGDVGLFDIVVGTEAGAGDLLAGETVDMTYDGALARTVTLVLGHSEITGLHLVFEDYMGNLFSTAPALFENFTDIYELDASFQVPYGTNARVYAVFAFSNDEFFEGKADWRPFIAAADELIPTETNNAGNYIAVSLAAPPNAELFHVIYGADVQMSNIGLAMAWDGADEITINGVEYDIALLASSPTEAINVVQPLLRGIAVRDQFTAGIPLVDNDDTIVGGVVGDVLNLVPEVTRSGASLVGNTSTLVSVVADGTFLGDVVEMDISEPTYARPENYGDPALFPPGVETDYGLGLLQATLPPVDSVTVSFLYTFTLNGIEHTEILPEAGSALPDAYEFHVEIGHPRVERIFLVARNSNPVNLSQRGTRTIDGQLFENLYTQPFHFNSTFQVAPVALNSGAWLAGEDFLTDLLNNVEHVISLEDIATYADYLRFMDVDDFDFVSNPWTFIRTGNRVLPQLPPTSGDIAANFRVSGPTRAINPATGLNDAMRFTFAPDALDLTTAGETRYSTIGPVGGPAPATAPLELFNLAEPSEVNVVDLSATILQTSPIPMGTPVLVDVRYFVSSSVLIDSVIHTSRDEVPATFFGNVLPEMSSLPGLAWNPSNPNALTVTELTFICPAGTQSVMHVDLFYSGDYLQITPHLPGTYRLALAIQYNNAGLRVPYYEPGFVEIEFTVEMAPLTRTVYYGESLPFGFAASWTHAVEVPAAGGSPQLDATALSGGFLRMTDNTSGTTTVHIYNGATRVAVMTADLEALTFVNAELNRPNHASILTRLHVVDGQTFTLYWEVEYLATNGSTIFRNEPIDDIPTRWIKQVTGNDGLLLLDGMLATVQADGSGWVAYQVIHAGGTQRVFWVDVDGNVTMPLPNYVITNDPTDITATVSDVTLFIIGGTATLFAWDVDADALAPIDVVTTDNHNIAVVHTGPTPGSFIISAVSPGTTFVTIYPMGGGSITIPVTVGGVQTFDVSGRIFDEAGQPVDGATVTITGWTFTETFTTGADGAYIFTDVPNGVYTVTASAMGLGTGSIPSLVVNGADLVDQDITLAIGPAFNISGQIRSQVGNAPVPNATVTLLSLTNGFLPVTITADAAGNYIFTDVPDGFLYRVIAAYPGFGTGSMDVLLSGAAIVNHNVLLPPAAGALSFAVSGVVLDDAGDYVPEATVIITGQTNDFTATVTAGVDGAFSFNNVPNRDIYVAAAMDGAGAFGSIFVHVYGAPETGQDIAFGTTVGPTFSVSGEILDEEDEPIAGAVVEITGPSFIATAITGAGGVYTFATVPTGVYTVTAEATGFQANEITVTVAEANLIDQDISLTPIVGGPPTFDVSGQVVSDDTDAPIAGATVT
ncbi:MAG: carboxypeptidase regulatory-like domain-containing protein, partial [Oscillospiraceae bacterium]|nr:carboxypeptidase regulatory-like domain-containing protein [Oscillospiraceae bacterium]